MAKPRSSKSTLFEVLNHAACPIYLLNPEGQILFANEPLCKWLNTEFDQIKMATCLPTTDRLEKQPEDSIRGLAIPLSAYQKPFSTGMVFRTAADRHLIYRAASFTRLSGTQDVNGNVLVAISGFDQPKEEIREQPEPWLRQVIADLRSFETQQRGFDQFIGISPLAERLQKQIQAACKTDCNLLVSGPSGSGIKKLAKLIHQARWNEDTPSLTELQCSLADAPSIQDTVLQLQRELRSNSPPNWLLLVEPEQLSDEAAHELGGFLELPNHELKLVTLTRHPDKIATTLSSYLNVMHVEVPGFQDRKADLPIVANYLLKCHCNNDLAEFNPQAQQALIDYDWPNNLKELDDTLLEVASKTQNEVVKLEDFPDRFHHALQAQQIGGNEVTQINLDDYLATIETELIGRAMQQANNNKAKACKLLGVSRAKLGRRIQMLGLSQEEADPIIFEESHDHE